MGEESKVRVKQDKPTDTIPLSLDGDLCKTYRHSRVGGNPQGGDVNKTTQPPIPLSLDERGIKACPSA